MTFPKMLRVKQELEGPMLSDIPGAVRETMRSLRLQDRVKPGQTVALTSGSRGVANIDRITKAKIEALPVRSTTSPSRARGVSMSCTRRKMRSA